MNSQTGRGLVHFSPGILHISINRRPKIWTCPLRAALEGNSISCKEVLV